MSADNVVARSLDEGSSGSALLVLGMHRSGTSAITGALGLCGAWVGEETELTSKNIENLRGFWERRDLRQVCDGILHSAGFDWWKVAGFDPDAVPHEIVSRYRRRFEKIVAELNEHGTWVVKEPRLCLVLPVLRDYIWHPVCVHIFRNPLEVAQSLRIRNGFSIAAGLALWEAYNLHALNASEGLARVSVSHKSLMLHPLDTLNALVEQLEELAVAHLAKPERGLVERFIDPSLYRQRVTDEDTEGCLLPSQRELWLRLRSNDVFRQDGNASVSQVTRRNLHDLESTRFSLTRLQDTIQARDKTVSGLESRVSAQEQTIQARDKTVSGLESRVSAQEQTIQARDKTVSGLESRVSAQEQTIQARDKTVSGLESRVSAQEQTIQARDKTVSGLESRVSAQEQTIQARDKTVSGLESRVSAQEQTIQARDKTVSGLESRVSAQEQTIQARDKTVSGLESRVSAQEQTIQARDKTVSGLESRVSAQEQTIQARDKTVSGLESRVSAQEQTIQARDKTVSGLESRVSAQEQTIQARDKTVSGLESRVSAQEQTIQARDKTVSGLESRVSAQEQTIQARDKTVSGLESRVSAQEQTIQARDKTVSGLESRVSAQEQMLREVYTSTSWKITAPVRGVKLGARWLLKNLRRVPAFLFLPRARQLFWLSTGQQPHVKDIVLSGDTTGWEVGKNKQIASITSRLSGLAQYRQRIESYAKLTASRQYATRGEIRVAIYTAISDNYNSIKLPERLNPDFGYILFTDLPAPDTKIWQLRPMTCLHSDKARSARYIKTHPHLLLEGYDVAVWIDANIMILDGLDNMIETFLSSGKAVGAIPHPLRNSIYEEIAACEERSKDEADVMREQIAKYADEGFFHHDLIESNFMIFDLRHEKMARFLDTWWREIDNHSKRDQLSLNYSLAEAGLEWLPLIKRPNSIRHQPGFAFTRHDKGVGPDTKLIEALQCVTVDPYAGPSYTEVKKSRIRANETRSVDIIVCVHNALDYVRGCLESVLKTRSGAHHRLIIIDDGSGEATEKYLEQFADQTSHCELYRNNIAQGYSKAANRGLAASTGEVVILLNSDTVVTSNWVEKLSDAVLSTPGAGIVGPLSNAASYQSIPEYRGSRCQTAVNELPSGLTPEAMNSYCEQWTVADILPRVPLLHGFCFGVTRKVIEKIGYFDAESFPSGYGEENDYCFRATDVGFGLVVATHTYVFHAKSKSYTEEKRLPLARAASKTFRRKHGPARVRRAESSMAENPILSTFRARAKNIYQASTQARDKTVSGLESQVVSAQEKTISGLESQVRAQKKTISGLESQVSAQEKMLRELYTSTSWKITAPVRGIKLGARWLLKNPRRAPRQLFRSSTGQQARAKERRLTRAPGRGNESVDNQVSAQEKTIPARDKTVSGLESKAKTRITVIAWDLGHNPLGRAYLLADILRHDYDVELIGAHFPRYGDRLWEPLRNCSRVTIKSFPGGNFPEHFKRMEDIARQVEGDLIYVSKSRLPGLELAILAKLHRNRPVIVDVDDYEPGFFKHRGPLTLDAVKSARHKLDFNCPHDETWTRYGETLIPLFEQLTVSNEELQKQYGGMILPHIRDEHDFDPTAYPRDAIRAELGFTPEDKVIVFAGTLRWHKGFGQVAGALEGLNRPDYKLLLVGSAADRKSARFLKNINPKWVKAVPGAQFDKLPGYLCAGDLICLLQDKEKVVSHFQLPAKFTDGLSMGIPILATGVPPLANLAKEGLVELLDDAPLEQKIDKIFRDYKACKHKAMQNREMFLRAYSYGANRPRLKDVIDRLLHNPAPIPDAFHELIGWHRELFSTATGLPRVTAQLAAGPVSASQRHVPASRPVTPRPLPTRSYIDDKLDIVFFWKQNDTGIYGRRQEMVVKYLAKDSRVHRILHFDKPVSISEAYKYVVNFGRINHARLVFYRLLRRKLGLEDKGKIRFDTFLFVDKHRDTGFKTGFMKWMFPSEKDYLDKILKRYQVGQRRTVFWVCPKKLAFSSIEARFKPDLVVADVIDDLRIDLRIEQSSSQDKRILQRNYEEVLARSHLTFVNCHSVFEAMQEFTDNVHLLPNAAECLEEEARHWKKPAELRRIKGPVIGYAGNLGSARIDLDLLTTVASERPDWNLVFIGSMHRSKDILKLNRFKNVYFLGVRSYDKAVRYIHHFDVAMIPHLDNELTRHMNPLKLYVYFSLHVPVVTTPIANVGDFREFIQVGRTPEEFIDGIRYCLNNDTISGNIERLRGLLKANSWDERTARILTLIEREFARLDPQRRSPGSTVSTDKAVSGAV